MPWPHIRGPDGESRGFIAPVLLWRRYEALVERNIHEDGIPVKLGWVIAPVIPPPASLRVIVPTTVWRLRTGFLCLGQRPDDVATTITIASVRNKSMRLNATPPYSFRLPPMGRHDTH